MSTQTQQIIEETAKIGITISESQADQFIKFYTMLIEKNKVMNLTSITEFEDVLKKHFIDSLSIVKAVDLSGNQSLIDVGTGAGFPGIPIKIVFPKIKCTLIDSVGKRISFLDEVIEALRLHDIETIHGRSEDLAQNKKYREKFDLCTSRAVASLPVLAEYCLPYVKTGGVFVSYKSGKIIEEAEEAKKAIRILGGKQEKLTAFELYGMGRSLITIRKTAHTPGMYPRKAGTPSKSPII
ncbi:MAG TPA: 16S rRNA (guanine(527)-N(7))-methyltransferase RsmG [Lachnospiraceae bacterium]|nr:16S rRNA (guanine(527)-N(7))-methyltransferase RsmG [Lachnospiraceae bacterium]